MKPLYEQIVFDLDDTLLDTSGALVPLAVRRSLTAMISAGLPLSIEEAAAKRSALLLANPRADVWAELSKAAPAEQQLSIRRAGFDAFYQSDVDDFPSAAFREQDGARELLEFAENASTIHLVSAGDERTQSKKVERLGIRRFFASLTFVKPEPGAKQLAFRLIEQKFRKDPSDRFVSIGNRVDTDIGEAKALGWSTVWVRYGEHIHILPQTGNEIPDFEVSSPRMLLHLWQQQFRLKQGSPP